MKRQKRDMQERAYQRGYRAGLDGRTRSTCPHVHGPARTEWLLGWHEGRRDHWDGLSLASGMEKMALR
ncbi:MAG: ribosome modulation factor [Spongiibacteraceae bacterium]|jgi:ribosome modulation factor|nr:ribosome modulation factor [Spongiibacteraceae bacterium]